MDKSSKYGYFSPDGREYIIVRPDTPRPWINYLTNGKFTSLCSATGGGFSFYIDPGLNRITRALPGDTTFNDRPGRYLYIRDNDSGEYWSVNWQPVMAKPEFWEARIGLGYNKISSINKKIQTDAIYFVPLDEDLEIWDLKIKNLSDRKRNLSVTSYVEWVLGNFSKDLSDRNFDSLFNEVYYKENVIYATKRSWDRPDKRDQPWGYWAYMTGSEKFECFDCVKEDFVGQYRFLSNPIAIEKGFCQTGYGESEDAIGSLTKIFELDAGEERKLHFVVGIEKETETIARKKAVVSKRGFVEEKLKQLHEFWNDYVNKLVVKTPSPDMDLSVNTWNKYQAYIASQMGEMISFYIGAGSWGFRDESQHIYGVLPMDHEFVRKKMIELLEHQLEEGNSVHAWNRLTGEGYITNHSDDPQWLVMMVLNYLKETGDLKILKKRVKYFDKNSGTVLEHLLKALDHTLYHVSPNGVPLRRTADWNDALSGGHFQKGESIMVANQVAWNILEIVPVLTALGKKTKAAEYRNIYDHLKRTVNELFWDGEWFVRATDDEGRFIGTKKNQEGKIHINSQSWSVISHIASNERATVAMDSVWRHLMTKYGALTFTPSYTKANSYLGVISQFAPGTKENATVFSHPNAWVIIAETLLGRGDKAFEAWRRTSFLTRGQEPDVYKVEPYVYPEYTYGPESPHFGLGSYSWMTGSAAWFLRACTDYILGARPTLEGLVVDPCIPKGWYKFEIKRVFRGATYNIVVKNPKHIHKGIEKVMVDGKEITGNLLPDFKKGEHQVEVTIG